MVCSLYLAAMLSREAGYVDAGFRGLNKTDNPLNGASDAAGWQVPAQLAWQTAKPAYAGGRSADKSAVTAPRES